MLEYDTLRLVWWLLLGVLLAGFAVMDGFDLGVAALLRLLAHDDEERRALLETVEPVWEGNQVWFVLGGGAVFAAWPLLYAAAFSGFYFALLLVLLAFILRPVGFGFRSKLPGARWRGTWDWILSVSGAAPALLFGVAFGNLFLGAPFGYDTMLRLDYRGGLLDLLRPFPLLVGVVSLSLLCLHGAAYAEMKADARIAARAARWRRRLALAYVLAFAAAGAWLATGVTGFHLDGAANTAGPSNPLLKLASRGGTWFDGPLGRWALAWGGLGMAGGLALALRGVQARSGTTFLVSAFSVIATVFAGGFALFPFLLPSSLDPRASLTVWDASSSRTTLGLMLAATVLFLPLVLAYTAWIYRVLRGRVTLESLRRHHGLY